MIRIDRIDTELRPLLDAEIPVPYRYDRYVSREIVLIRSIRYDQYQENSQLLIKQKEEALEIQHMYQNSQACNATHTVILVAVLAMRQDSHLSQKSLYLWRLNARRVKPSTISTSTFDV